MRHFISLLLFALLLLPWQAFSFDHDYHLLNDLLSSHVQNGLVDYKSIKADPKNLDMFVVQAGAVSHNEFDTWTQQQQLAFLINLYNAVTIQLIINEYPVASIRKIGGLLKSPWKLKVVPLFREMITLDHLEHNIIRPWYNEPRIHFALVCAAKGCPILRSNAYLPDILKEQLEDQTRQFLQSNPQKNNYDPNTETLYLSPIFKWYAEDFEAASGSIQQFVKNYMPQVDIEAKIRYTDYDWSLNEQE